jgi:hypothetical protein
MNSVMGVPIMAAMLFLATRHGLTGEHVIGRRWRRLRWAANGVMALAVGGWPVATWAGGAA